MRRAVMPTANAVEEEMSKIPVCWSEEVASEVACVGLKSFMAGSDWLNRILALA